MHPILTAALIALLATTGYAQNQPVLPPAPGQLVDIGDHTIHLYCTGEGSPTVVMDAGLGDGSLSFRDLQQRVSTFTRVCTYDRAGYGWSEPGPEPRTSQQIANELGTALNAAGVKAPIILVGHSFGGLNTILFAHQHPELVAGVVLIDASHPEQAERLQEVSALVAMQEQQMHAFRALAEAATQGQLTPDSMLANAPAGLPEELRQTWAELFVRPENLRAGLAEFDAIEDSASQVRENGTLGETPLIVIAHGLKLGDMMPPEVREQAGLSLDLLHRYEEIWRELQEDHLTRSTNSKLLVAANSPHYIHFSEPDLVVAAIRELATGRP